MKELIMYRCEACGNLICMIDDSGVVPECCKMPMTRVIANTEDAAMEKHIPVIHKEGPNVQIRIGSLPHPMTPEHYISLVFLLTNIGIYMRRLAPGDDAETTFTIRLDEDVISVYAWCNIHGLWKN